LRRSTVAVVSRSRREARARRRASSRAKVSRDQVERHRELILAAASRLFRQRGFDGVTVAVMSASLELK
jgi:AcrR family transcriptional regulator